MKLSSKILIVIAICIAVTMTIVSIYIIRTDRASRLQAAYTEAESLNRIAFNTMLSIMNLGHIKPDAIHNIIKNMSSKNSNVLEITLLHSSDIVKTFKDKEMGKEYEIREDEIPRDEVERLALSGNPFQRKITFHKNGKEERALQNITPIIANKKCLICHSVKEGTTLAALSTTISLEPAFQAMNKTTNILAIILVIGFIGTLVLLYYALQVLVIRPVSTVASTARIIAKEGDLSRRAEIKSKDEIGDLATSFNQMTKELQKTIVSRDYLDDIIESTTDSLIVLTPKGIIQTVNQFTLNLLGYESDDLVGKSIHKIIAKEDTSWVEGIGKKGSIRSVEKTFKSKDGSEIPILFSASAMRDKEGRIQGIICAAQSIVELRDVQKSLQRINELQTVQYHIAEATSKEKDLKALFKAIHTHLKEVIDTTNFYIAFYDRGRDLLSFPYFVDEIDPPPAPKKLGGGLTEYVLNKGESLMVKKDEIYQMANQGEIELIGTPSEVWVGVPLKVENKVVGVIAVQSYTDPTLYNKKEMGVLEFVSEQIAHAIVYKQAEDALRESEERYRSTIESMQDLIFFIDKEGYFREFYQPEGTIFLSSPETLLGTRFDEILPKHVSDPLSKAIKTLSKGGESQTLEYPLKIEGQTCWYVADITGRYDAFNNFTGVTMVVRDITERKKSEEKIRQSEEKYKLLSEKLAEANSMKELLLDVITHDLKNPAGVIHGMTEMMLEKNSKDEMLNVVHNCGKNLLKVVENATILAKVTLGEEIEKSEMDLVPMIKNVVNEYLQLLKDNNMDIQLILDKPLVVQANPIISEVFKNYISNAIKYASKGGKIIIEGEKKDGVVCVAVKDFGTTIQPKDSKIIFERTTQLKKGKKLGRGLGLAIVKRIAEAHHGEVWVEPNKPHGNVFYLKLPSR